MPNLLTMTFNRLLWFQIKKYRGYYLLALFALIATHFIQSLLPDLALKLAEQSKHLSANQLGIFVVTAVGIVIFRTSSRVFFFYPARQLQKILREEMVEKLSLAHPARYKQFNAGALFQFLSSDIEQVRALIGFVGLQGGNLLIALIILLPKIYHFHPKLLWALSPMVVCFLIFTIVVHFNREYFKKLQEAQGDIQNNLVESYNGKKTIMNFQAEKTFTSLFNDYSLKDLYYFYRSGLSISLFFPLVTLGVGLSFLWGAYFIQKYNLGASRLIWFSGFIFLFMEPLSYLSWIGVVISRSYASYKRLYDFNSELQKTSPFESTIEAFSTNKPEEITDHSWNQTEVELPFYEQTIQLKLEKNNKYILIGETGVGKSVLLEKLFTAFRHKNFAVSFVLQTPNLFNANLQENIFLSEEPSPDRLARAKFLLQLFGLHELVEDFEQIWSLELGENGKKISGGQQKRLALVRSLMGVHSDIILWDDPFSSVDLTLEKMIFSKCEEAGFFKDKILIITGHRYTSFKMCDRYFYIDKNNGVMESQLTKDCRNGDRAYEFFKQQMV